MEYFFRVLVYSTMVLSLSSCMLGPDFHAPASPSTPAYTPQPLPEQTVETSKIHAGKAQRFEFCRKIPGQWWQLFHSASLNELIEQGLNNNASVDAAQWALQQARENLAVQVGSLLFPYLTANGSAQRQRFSADDFGITALPPSTFNLFNVNASVSYTFDIFGAARRQIEAYCALVDYQRFLLEGTYLTLTSNIVTTAITEAQYRGQIKATRQIIQLEENLLSVIRQQFVLGAVSNSDVLAQQSQVAQLRATLPPLEKSLAQTRHALAVLVGCLPSEANLPEFFLEEIQLPEELPISIPSELVRQRPDIRAQEALLHQASAQIGVATANLLPQITLTGNYGWEGLTLSHLISPANNVWSIAGNILQPIFKGGALIAQRRAAIAAYEQAYAQYRQTVLQAFQNVADVLRAIEYDAVELKAQTYAETSARDLLVLTQAQYKLGAANYLNLLNAERQYQQALINRIQAQASRINDTAALFQALGGTW